jgi:hypothetical protein
VPTGKPAWLEAATCSHTGLNAMLLLGRSDTDSLIPPPGSGRHMAGSFGFANTQLEISALA